MYLLCIRFGRKCFVCFICNERIFALSLLLLELEILRVLRLYGLSLVSDDDHISLFLSLSIEHHDCFRVYMCASQLLTSPVYNIIHKTHAFCIFHSFTRFALWPDENLRVFEALSSPYHFAILPLCRIGSISVHTRLAFFTILNFFIEFGDSLLSTCSKSPIFYLHVFHLTAERIFIIF